ncbi:purine permease, partial [Paracoccus sp. DMF]|nr:purine permease [Paracoccus sp. DMF]
VAATGIRILSTVDFKGNKHNLFIVAVSLGLGMVPMIAPDFNQWLPHSLHTLIHSGILLAALAAVGLNWFFNGAPHTSDEEIAAAAHAAEAH